MSLEFPIELRVSRWSLFRVGVMSVPFVVVALVFLLPPDIRQGSGWLPELAKEPDLKTLAIAWAAMIFFGLCMLIAFIFSFRKFDERIIRIEPGPIVWVRGSMLRTDNWRKGKLIDLELVRASMIWILPFALSAKALRVTMRENDDATPISLPISWALLGVKDRQFVREVLMDRTGHLADTLKEQDKCQ